MWWIKLWVPLHARHFGHCRCLVRDTMTGEIPEHFDVFRSTLNQQSGYNTWNGYMPAKLARVQNQNIF